MAEEKENKEKKKKNNQEKKKRTLFQKIVNVFLYFFLGLFVLLIIFFGISQTSFFRDYLRETIIEEVNSAINGKLYIEEIDGTILTSLFFTNTALTLEQDTILHAEKIELKTSPLQLLIKRIYVRNFEIKNAEINLIEDKNGELNISKLIPPSPPDEDTTKSSFPFSIKVADLQLTNINFSLQKYNYVNSNEVYRYLNTDDFRVNNLNLLLTAFVDINENRFEVELENLSAAPNLKYFNLEELSGVFDLSPNGISVDNFYLKTANSEITLNVDGEDVNLFAENGETGLFTSPVDVELDAEKFHFNDLNTFVPSTEILHGNLKTNLTADGSLQKLNINNLEVFLDNTHLQLNGRLLNVDDAENLYISADFKDSYIDQMDVQELLPGLNIPRYPELGVLRFDTLSYSGEPLDFNTKAYLITDQGNVQVNGGLNLEGELMSYDINFKTRKLNIAPFAGITSNLNSRGKIKGKGVTPEKMNSSLTFRAGGSIIEGNRIDTLRFTGDAENKFIRYDVKASYDSTAVTFLGNIDFKQKKPAYELDGQVKNLNIAKFTKDTTLYTNINAMFTATGNSFDVDKIELFMSLNLMNSTFNDIVIDSTRAVVDLQNRENGDRVVNFISDLADITVTGNYTIEQANAILSNEIQFVTTAVNKKINEIFPEETEATNSIDSTLSEIAEGLEDNIKPLIDSTITFEYTVDFKDFQLLSLFLKTNQLDINGDINGRLNSTADSVSFTFNSEIEHVKYWGKNDVYFLSNFDLNFELQHSLAATTLKDIKTELTVDAKRIFGGSEIRDLHLELDLNNNNAYLDFYGLLEEYASANLTGNINIEGNTVTLALDTIGVRYEQFFIENQNKIKASYSQNNISFDQFKFVRNNTTIEINGKLSRAGRQNLTVDINNLRGKDISTNILNFRPENSLLSRINMNAEVTGSFSSPIITVNLNADSVTFKNKNFGSLKSELNYKNKNLSTNIRFVDTLRQAKGDPLKITGNIPIDLSFEAVEERMISDKQIELKMTANNFNLGAFGDILPEVNNLRGRLNADINLTGTTDNLNPGGYLTLRNAAFVAEANNLEYRAGLKLNISPDAIKLDSLEIENAPGTEDGGRITGSGEIALNNLNIQSSQFSLQGRLKVLGEASKTASPSVYGNLVISTDGEVQFRLTENETYLKAPITVEKANLTFPPTRGAYANTSEKFIYTYVEYGDTSTTLDFEQLKELSEEQGRLQKSKASKPSNLNLDIDVTFNEGSTIVFILAKELNYNLTAVIEGEIRFEKEGGRQNIQGVLNLMDESTLEFIKTFSADGTIRFESEITNPYLDITATYTDYYTPADTTQANEVLVAVKIKIDGPLNELEKNFIQNENNLAVYVGEDAIENNNPDNTKDASDALMFIVAGQFTEDLSPQQRSQAAGTFAGPATSLAGSLLGGFLNRYLGDYVRSVELRRVGSQTKFNLSGRVENVRYTIGGATDVFQDLSQANVRIEVPIFIENLLLRLERRESITETGISNEMINELGLKYRFEF